MSVALSTPDLQPTTPSSSCHAIRLPMLPSIGSSADFCTTIKNLLSPLAALIAHQGVDAMSLLVGALWFPPAASWTHVQKRQAATGAAFLAASHASLVRGERPVVTAQVLMKYLQLVSQDLALARDIVDTHLPALHEKRFCFPYGKHDAESRFDHQWQLSIAALYRIFFEHQGYQARECGELQSVDEYCSNGGLLAQQVVRFLLTVPRETFQGYFRNESPYDWSRIGWKDCYDRPYDQNHGTIIHALLHRNDLVPITPRDRQILLGKGFLVLRNSKLHVSASALVLLMGAELAAHLEREYLNNAGVQLGIADIIATQETSSIASRRK